MGVGREKEGGLEAKGGQKASGPSVEGPLSHGNRASFNHLSCRISKRVHSSHSTPHSDAQTFYVSSISDCDFNNQMYSQRP